jgi:DNA-binding transcriptional LysR family regulator
MQDSVIATKAAAVGEEGRLRIGYTDEFASELLPSAVSQVRRQHPSSQVELVLDLTPHLAEQLRTGLLDVALTCPIPEDSFDSGFRFTMLPPLPLCVALPLGHRLAASEAVKIAALKNEPFILGPVQSASERVFDRLFAQLGAQRKVVQRVPDTELLMSLVAEGIGIMIGYFGEQNMARNDLIIVPLREQDAQLSRALIWRNTYSNKLLEEFLRYFNAVGGDGMLGADTHGTTQGNEAQSGNPVTPSVGE